MQPKLRVKFAYVQKCTHSYGNGLEQLQWELTLACLVLVWAADTSVVLTNFHAWCPISTVFHHPNVQVNKTTKSRALWFPTSNIWVRFPWYLMHYPLKLVLLYVAAIWASWKSLLTTSMMRSCLLLCKYLLCKTLIFSFRDSEFTLFQAKIMVHIQLTF